MQSLDESCSEGGESPCARVQDIRRQWAIHEDEALAHRLQDEEIHIHYSGNRTRNAIVREDGKIGRHEQRREEEQALELRLRHLSLLQRQAEDDARVAQKLAEKYESQVYPEGADQNELDIVRTSQDALSSVVKMDASLLGASCLPSTSAAAENKENHGLRCFVDEEDLKQLQEQRDAELARQVQDEFEQYEKDKMLAIEAQDRELAKMLYDKEKARLKRAKERARLKAEAASLNKSPSNDETSSDTASELAQVSFKKATMNDITPSTSPPRIPEKSCEGILGFKATPKKLPPNPQRPSSSRNSDDPIPPYMPIHGFNRSNSKRPH